MDNKKDLKIQELKIQMESIRIDLDHKFSEVELALADWSK